VRPAGKTPSGEAAEKNAGGNILNEKSYNKMIFRRFSIRPLGSFRFFVRRSSFPFENEEK